MIFGTCNGDFAAEAKLSAHKAYFVCTACYINKARKEQNKRAYREDDCENLKNSV